MIKTFFLICISLCLSLVFNQCTKSDQLKEFRNKKIINEFPHYQNDPYLNITNTEEIIINDTIHNKEIVCAIQYQDKLNKTYQIKQFKNKKEAEISNYIVTHQGKCGSCSTLFDLAAYLSKNMTSPARLCGFYGFLSKDWSINCFIKLGFTQQCSEIWYFNTVNTRKNCFFKCMKAWIFNEPFVDKNGNLNSCLECDEELSGPVFKFYAGRTRRNSGIHSEIDRPSDEIYNITHCYY